MRNRLLMLAALLAAPMWADAQTCVWSVCPSSPDAAITTAAAFPPSSYGMAITVNDATEIINVRDNTPANETSYWARFYFDPNGGTPLLDGNRQRIFMFHDSTNTRLAAIIVRRVAGNLSFLARVWDGTNMVNLPGGQITDAWHYVTMRWVRATTPGGTDGQFEIFVDGTSAGSLTNLATGNSPGVDYARMGVFSPIQYNGTPGTYYFDEVEERRQTNPGAYVP